MKKYFSVLLTVLLTVPLFIGCEAGKGEQENSTNSLDGNRRLENSSNNNSTSVSENNLRLERKENFLNSTEGHDFLVISWKFSKAYLSGDVSTLKNYLHNPDNKSHYYNTENIFDNVEFMILKLSPENIKEDSIIAEYEFQLKGEDSYTYLYLEMKKVNNEWKVEHFGLEK